MIGPAIFESAQAIIARALDGESAEFDRLIPGANGESRWMTIRVVPDSAPSGDVPGAFVLMNDIHGLKQAQEALRASESELRLIMDNVPARVAYIDREYRYRFLNRHNEEWLGLKRDELTGRAVADVVGDERFAQMRPLLERVLQGETVSVEQLLAQPVGEERWESVHYAPNRDSEGRVIGIYAVHTDVHDQKRNEDALRRANWMLSSHINNTPLAVLEWDRDFRLVRWSPQAEQLFGWRADEVLGMPLDGNPLAARRRPRRRRRAPHASHERRGAADDGPDAQQPQGRPDDLVRVVPLVPARRPRQHRLHPVVRAGRVGCGSRPRNGCSTWPRATR